MIDVSGLSKGKVLAALYNAATPLGMGSLHADSRTMTEEDAERLIDGSPSPYFDYVKGRPLKVEINGHTVDPRLFDRDHGPGAAQRAVVALRKGSDSTPAEAEGQHAADYIARGLT